MRNINWSNSATLKKFERSDYGIHFAEYEQHETKKKNFFPVKVLFLELPNYKHLIFAILVFLDIANICSLYS